MKLLQKENKQEKGAKLCVNFRCSKTFFKVPEIQNLQSQVISELYTGDNRSKYSSNHKDIFKCAKKNYETLYNKETTSKAATVESL